MVSETEEVCVVPGRMEFRISSGSAEYGAWFTLGGDGREAAEAEDWIWVEYAVICVQGMEEDWASTTEVSWWYSDPEEGLEAHFLALSDF